MLAPADRPRISMGMASSIDGKVTTRERLKLRYGSDEDRRRLELRRLSADAVLIGKGQLLTDDPPLLLRNPELRAQRVRERGAAAAHPINVVAASTLDFDPARLDFFNHPETRRLVFTTAANDPARLEAARALAEVEIVPAGPDGKVDLAAMARRLRDRGVEHLLLEGGGTLNFAMLARGLVDELHLTLCPFVFGGSAVPGSVGGPGFDKEEIPCLELLSCETSPAGEIFLHYRLDPRGAVVEESATFRNAWRLRRHEPVNREQGAGN